MAAMAATGGEQVYATLLLTDSYLPGALVLAHSLRDAGAKKKLAAFFTLDSVSAESIAQLQTVYDHVIPVARIRNNHRANLYLMNRPDLDSAFTKINLWKQVQFSKIVYLDADVVAYRAPDELFTLQHPFGAAPDIGWPDLFNTGVMVLTPNSGDYYAMLAMAERGISFDGADQGLLNMYFKNDVHRLSFSYNVTPSGHYQYVPAYRHFQSSINMVHFIGPNKPWFQGRHAQHGDSPYAEMVGRWWTVYDRHYRAQETAAPQQDQAGSAYVQYFTKGEFQPTAHPVSDHNPQPTIVDRSNESSQGDDGPQTGPVRPSSESLQPETREQEAQQPAAQTERRESHSRMQSWDAQWQPPPRDSKPEAMNFPATHYEMSQDTAPFVPPARYPSPPRNMWYEVPKAAPAKPSSLPRAIFPWEGHQPQPARSFPVVQLDQVSGDAGPDPSAEHGPQAQPESMETPAADTVAPDVEIRDTPANPWTSFTRSNAWDEVPEINKYVERVQGHRQRRSMDSQSASAGTQGQMRAATPGLKGKQTFHGLRLTDFPTEAERPSLPVTPAPIRRPSFWGDDGEEEADDESKRDVPLAPGVPTQSEWDPTEQLQKLAQQQSDELLRRLSGNDEESPGVSRVIPSRSLPFGSETWRADTYTGQSGPRLHSPTPIKGEPRTTDLVRKMASEATEGTPSQRPDENAALPKGQSPEEELEKTGLKANR